jgi:predicted porin
MKSPLFTAAALAVIAGAASAQSSNVTIYGIVDAGVIKMNNGTSIGMNPGAGNVNQWNVKSGAAPRLGFRGAEDLGGGLTALFHLEHRFNMDDGATASPFWAGRSVVGLRSASLGEVHLGRDYQPAFWPAVAVDPWGWDTIGQMGRAYTWANYAGGDPAPTAPGIRDANTVNYKTPDLNGFTAMGSVALGEGGATRGRAIGANAIYASGPIYVGFGYDTAKHTTGTADARLMLVSAAYDFGIARVSGVIARSRSTANVDSKSFVLGARIPVGSGQARVAYGRLDSDGANNTATKVSVGYFYSLSKRTTLYADLGTAKQDTRTRSTGTDVGIKHTF